MIRKALALALLLASPAAAAPAPSPVPVQASPAPAAPRPPRLRCPCEQFGYKALTPKGQALADYWKARRAVKLKTGVAGGFFLLSLMAKDGRALRESDAAFRQAQDEFSAARRAAEAAGAIRVTGDDLQDGVEFLAKPGVDFVIERPK